MATNYQLQEALEDLMQQTPVGWSDVEFWYIGMIECLLDRDAPRDQETVEALKYLRWREKWPQTIEMGSGIRFMMLFSKGHLVEDDPSCWHSHATFPELTQLYNQCKLPCASYISQRQFVAACMKFVDCYPRLKRYLKPME